MLKTHFPLKRWQRTFPAFNCDERSLKPIKCRIKIKSTCMQSWFYHKFKIPSRISFTICIDFTKFLRELKSRVKWPNRFFFGSSRLWTIFSSFCYLFQWWALLFSFVLRILLSSSKNNCVVLIFFFSICDCLLFSEFLYFLFY